MIDAHAHLTDEHFALDLAATLERAAAAALRRVLTCGEDVPSSERALAIAHPIVRVAVGIHPHRAAACDRAALSRLRELAANPLVVAIGEIGLDRAGRSAPFADQERAFAAQLELASRLALPVVVHVREAGDDVRRIVDASPPVRGMIHCYSEGPDEVDGWLARGFHLSFAGTLTYPKNDRLREAARRTPADRLLVETDAPYLTPQAVRGRRNEPAYVLHTAAALAEMRAVPEAELWTRLERNAAALFGPRWSGTEPPGRAS